jgi:enoyl-[acyl-carrier-protein] reductase (NADH)
MSGTQISPGRSPIKERRAQAASWCTVLPNARAGRRVPNTSREGFRIAHDVSVYSLIAVVRAAAPLMEEGGSIITMTYYGAEKVVPTT